jgi:hypothetical protein
MNLDLDKFSREDLLREKIRRLKYDQYRRNPLKWAEEVMNKPPENFKWSLHKGYENHVWDGSKDPISSAWECLAKGYYDENKNWIPKGEWAAISAATGCHAKGQEILMFDGSIKKVEDIVIGDKLMGDDSTERNVQHLYRGKTSLFEVDYIGLGKIVVNELHNLCVVDSKGVKSIISPLAVHYINQIAKTENIKGYDYKGNLYDLEINFKEYGQYFGFELDNNHLYKLPNGVVTHNTGKTHTLAFIALWFLDCFEDALVITSAPKEDQLKLNLWGEINRLFNDFKKVRTNAVLTKLMLKAEGANELSPYNDTHQMIGFVAGSGADEESANKARGFHRKNMLIIFEETPGMNSAIITAFKNTCTGENNVILAVGNPDNEYDQLYKFSSLNNVHSFRISAFDYPNVVVGKEIYAGAVTRSSIERRKAELKTEDHPQWLSSVRGITPKNDTYALIKSDWVDAAYIRGTKFNSEIVTDKEGYNSCGVDVAQSINGDEAATAYFQSNVLKAIYEFTCPNATDLAYNLIFDDDRLIMEKRYIYNCGKLSDFDIMPQCIGVDTVGVGVATLNAFRQEGLEVTSLFGAAWNEAIVTETDEKGNEKPMYKFANLRSQMYYEARQDFMHGRIIIDIDEKMFEKLKNEICAIRWEKNDNAIAIEKKSDIKKRIGGKSPNLADAFVYANWVRKGYKMFGGAMPILFGSHR